MKKKRIFILLLIFFIGIYIGSRFPKFYRNFYPSNKLLSTFDPSRYPEKYLIHYNLSKTPTIDCNEFKKPHSAVILVFGQSNAASHGSTTYIPKHEVYNFTAFDGKCYRARDPLIGTTRKETTFYKKNGAMWSRLADKLIDKERYERVLLVPVAYMDTAVEKWIQGTKLNDRIIESIKKTHNTGLKFTHLLWHQGESDNVLKTQKQKYKERFNNMLQTIRNENVNAPLFISKATICWENTPNQEMREAQEELVNPAVNIFPGPDTDIIDQIYDRYDGCHFSDSGLWKVSDMWYDILVEYDDSSAKNRQ